VNPRRVPHTTELLVVIRKGSIRHDVGFKSHDVLGQKLMGALSFGGLGAAKQRGANVLVGGGNGVRRKSNQASQRTGQN
jgi:hypothetical protein